MSRLFSCIFAKNSDIPIPYGPSTSDLPRESIKLPSHALSIFNLDNIPSSPPISAFPSDILRWMKKNANPRQSFKLMKSHRYFCYKSFPFKFSAVSKICGFCENNDFITVDRTINGSYIQDGSKYLWITKRFKSYLLNTSFLLSKIIFCDIKDLSLLNQYLSMNDLKFLTAAGKIEYIHLTETVITGNNKYFVALEDIFECIKNVKMIFFRDLIHSFNSEKITTTLKNLRKFKLWNFLESFNFKALSNFIIKHKTVEFSIHVFEEFPANKRSQLQIQVDKIIKTLSPKFPIPDIKFCGQTVESKHALAKLRKKAELKKQEALENTSPF